MTTSGIAPSTAPPVARLIDAFHRLPGVGPKGAQRLTYFLIRMPRKEAEELAEAILSVKDRIVLCDTCANIGEQGRVRCLRRPGTRPDADLRGGGTSRCGRD